jgi:hypothetical protein
VHEFQELKRLLPDGISTDIYLALEAHSIFKTIGEGVRAATASTYEPMLPHHTNSEPLKALNSAG